MRASTRSVSSHRCSAGCAIAAATLRAPWACSVSITRRRPMLAAALIGSLHPVRPLPSMSTSGCLAASARTLSKSSSATALIRSHAATSRGQLIAS